MNDFQEFTLSKNSEKEITRIIQETKNKESLDLTNITEFETYLSRLKESNYIVFIVIRDEGVSAINEQLEKHLNELGIQTDFSKLDSANNKKYFRNSYYAVVNQKKEAIEHISVDKLEYSYTLDDGNIVDLSSSGLITGEAACSILFNGEERSVGRRGMNFFVYDLEKHSMVDSVCFDTCSDLTCTRVTKKYR